MLVLLVGLLFVAPSDTQAQNSYYSRCYWVRNHYGRLVQRCEYYRNYGQWRRNHNRNRRYHRYDRHRRYNDRHYRRDRRPRVRVNVSF